MNTINTLRLTDNKLRVLKLLTHYNKKIISFPYEKLPDSLIKGKLGLVLYLCMMYEQNQDEIYIEKITEILSVIFKSLETTDGNSLLSDSSFGDGLSGLGWIILMLIEKGLLDEEYRDQIVVFNEIAFEYADKYLDKNNFDFLYGSIGVLMFLEKSKNKVLFDKLVDKLYTISLTNKDLFSTASENPYIGDMNFGFPHGYLSTITILGNAQVSFGDNKKYQKIIDKCINRIMNHVEEDYKVENINIYKPHKIYYENKKLISLQNDRLAWCNSDLSLIYLLSKIDHQTKKFKYKAFVNKVGDSVVKRKSMNVTMIKDDHFCHGSSGVAQLFSELYGITGDKKYKESQEYWVDRTIQYLENDLSKKELTRGDMSLYYGYLGALLMLCSDQGFFSGDWKEVFLIS